jgi:hypothetical protein
MQRKQQTGSKAPPDEGHALAVYYMKLLSGS